LLLTFFISRITSFYKASSSIGRASVSKTEGWGFETLLACQDWQGFAGELTEYMADKVKLAVALLLVAAGIAGYYYLADSATIIRIAPILAGLVLAAVLAWFTAPGKQFYGFSQEAVEETKKVVWPTRKETFQITGVVMLFVVVMALFLWMVDAGLLSVVKLLMGRSE
jgi:preprotein translocase subunit SecE